LCKIRITQLISTLGLWWLKESRPSTHIETHIKLETDTQCWYQPLMTSCKCIMRWHAYLNNELEQLECWARSIILIGSKKSFTTCRSKSLQIMYFWVQVDWIQELSLDSNQQIPKCNNISIKYIHWLHCASLKLHVHNFHSQISNNATWGVNKNLMFNQKNNHKLNTLHTNHATPLCHNPNLVKDKLGVHYAIIHSACKL